MEGGGGGGAVDFDCKQVDFSVNCMNTESTTLFVVL